MLSGQQDSKIEPKKFVDTTWLLVHENIDLNKYEPLPFRDKLIEASNSIILEVFYLNNGQSKGNKNRLLFKTKEGIRVV